MTAHLPKPDALAKPHGTQEPKGCRWVYGDPQVGPHDWRYCGRRRVRDKPYCAGHYRRVWCKLGQHTTTS